MKKLLNNINNVKKTFKDASVFEKAMTHRSWVNENHKNNGHNERLEFLGDAILEFVVSAFLFNRFPDQEEGFLTALRANIVNTVSLADLAKKLELGQELRLSKGEELGGGRKNESLLADTVEALIGALYFDQGFEASEEFIETNFLSDIESKLREPLKDAKSRLQETAQAKGYGAPKYYVVQEKGPDHDKEFEVEVQINGEAFAKGVGKSKNRAEQEAAAAGLVNFEVDK